MTRRAGQTASLSGAALAGRADRPGWAVSRFTTASPNRPWLCAVGATKSVLVTPSGLTGTNVVPSDESAVLLRSLN